MSPHLVDYQLVILVLLWWCIMLPHLWPRPPGGAPRTPTQPITPKRRRSSVPKVFAGLTQKPPCPLCEQETSELAPAPPRRPDPMPPKNRRPRTVDTSMHFCPHPECDYRGWLGLNNLRANGHPNGGPWRQCHCTACNGFFPAHHGTIFHGKQAAVELIVRVLTCLAEGLALREGTCDQTPFEVLRFPPSIRNGHFVSKTAQKSCLLTSEGGKTAGFCRQGKFPLLPV
jgi:hypothetical protein